MPPPDGDLFSLPLHPSLHDTGQSAALAGDRPASCPCHSRTAHRNRTHSGVSGAGVASVAEAMTANMRHGLI